MGWQRARQVLSFGIIKEPAFKFADYFPLSRLSRFCPILLAALGLCCISKVKGDPWRGVDGFVWPYDSGRLGKNVSWNGICNTVKAVEKPIAQGVVETIFIRWKQQWRPN